MKTCLGFICLNEAKFLRLHLPYMLDSGAFDGVVMVDGGSTDNTLDVVNEIAQQCDVAVFVNYRQWDWNFGAQQNHLIAAAEKERFDAMFKWDPDELLFEDHIHQGFGLLGQGYKALVLNRINFERDRLHYSPYTYPDQQTRFHVLNEGFRWRLRLHASVNAFEIWKEVGNATPNVHRDIIRVPHINIFHYEGIRPLAERRLKWENYARVGRGEPALTDLPSDIEVPQHPVRFFIEYVGPQPLDPAVIGEKAPYD